MFNTDDNAASRSRHIAVHDVQYQGWAWWDGGYTTYLGWEEAYTGRKGGYTRAYTRRKGASLRISLSEPWEKEGHFAHKTS